MPKNGSDVTSAAIRLARAYTNRKLIIRCRQQPFLSFNDWFIASTSKANGIPKDVGEWVLSFDYNSIESLEKLFDEYPNQIACVIMEPFTDELPKDGFLEKVKLICEKAGTVLIFDEIICGFRTHVSGGQSIYNVTPHLSTFGKGIANGYPMAVLCGRSDIMKLGNMDKNVFLLSCTFGGETIGITAADACIDFMLLEKTPEAMTEYGTALMQHFNSLISKHDLCKFIRISGHPARPELRFKNNGQTDLALKTLFMQKMFEHHIFMERIALSHSHGKDELSATKSALDIVIPFLNTCIKNDQVNNEIIGNTVVPVFTY
ncbi:MAG: aminotransferase class III-fold pyridoxal phosphate-dependent enzyme [Bacteroidia bacterium]